MEFKVAEETYNVTECLKSHWKDCVKSYIVSSNSEKYKGSNISPSYMSRVKCIVEVSDKEDLLLKIAKFGMHNVNLLFKKGETKIVHSSSYFM